MSLSRKEGVCPTQPAPLSSFLALPGWPHLTFVCSFVPGVVPISPTVLNFADSHDLFHHPVFKLFDKINSIRPAASIRYPSEGLCYCALLAAGHGTCSGIF